MVYEDLLTALYFTIYPPSYTNNDCQNNYPYRGASSFMRNTVMAMTIRVITPSIIAACFLLFPKVVSSLD